ncbi:MAG: hypothetical protein HYS18_12160 [Burkholderiales bacterium]|nr:hypothetical protein [Burkholderiales bacterium]
MQTFAQTLPTQQGRTAFGLVLRGAVVIHVASRVGVMCGVNRVNKRHDSRFIGWHTATRIRGANPRVANG